MMHMVGVVGVPSQLRRRSSIAGRDQSTSSVAGLEGIERDPQPGGLDLGHAEVLRHGGVEVLLGHAVHPQQSNAVGDVGAVGDDGAPITDAAQVLGGVEAVHRGRRARVVVQRAVRLGGVLDDREVGDRQRCWPTVEVHDHDGPRAVGPRRVDQALVERGRVGAHIDEHRRCAQRGDRRCGGHRGERGHDHLVAHPHPQCAQRQLQRGRTRRHGDRVGCRRPVRQLGLERGGLVAEQERATGRDSLRRNAEPVGHGSPATGEVYDRYHERPR